MRVVWVLAGLLLVGCDKTHVRLEPLVPPALPAVSVVPLPRDPVVIDLPRPTGEDSIQVIEQANGRALIQPDPRYFINAEVVYPSRRSAIYRVDTCLFEPTDLILPEGERLLKYVSGDKRFIREITEEGLDPVHIVIKATRLGLRARITMVTDKFRYYLQVRSGTKGCLAAVTWRHPTPPQAPKIGLYGVDYGISSTDSLFSPQYVWDYEGQTYMLFDPRVPQISPPTVTVRTAEATGYVNYGPTLAGRVYVIDRLLSEGERFELGSSSHPGVTVQIARVPETRYIYCPGDEACGVVQRWTRRRDGSQ